MGIIKKPDPVKLFIAITYNSYIDLESLLEVLKKNYGDSDLISPIIDFSSFTDYYQPEMGANLQKCWISFKKLIHPGELPAIKHQTNELEVLLSREKEHRDVNLDPGYITRANMILATTKNYSHRIYLTDGIYGDVHYIFSNKKFQLQPWTYPDYKEDVIRHFFEKVRDVYLQQLKGREQNGNL